MWLVFFVFNQMNLCFFPFRHLSGLHIKLLCDHEDPLCCHTCSDDGHGDVTRTLSGKTGITTARYGAPGTPVQQTFANKLAVRVPPPKVKE